MQSLQSDAFEPTRNELRDLPRLDAWWRSTPRYGLLIVTVALAIAFSVAFPSTFPTFFNMRSMIAARSIVALLALAALCPMVTGKIDLTVGYGVVLWHITVIALQTDGGVPWPFAVVITIFAGGVLGILNGVLVEFAQIDSFIATLGTGTILYAAALWYTGGSQVVGDLPDGFELIDTASIAGLPIGCVYVVALAVLLWACLEHTPLGRELYAVGANPRAAALNGLPVRRHILLAFAASGTITGATGVVLAAKLGIGQASVGLDYLLPALVGVFLGSTAIKPGRVNVWGTVVAMTVLAIGISGIQQTGASYFVEPLFNGLTLLLAVGIVAWSQRPRRGPALAEAGASLLAS